MINGECGSKIANLLKNGDYLIKVTVVKKVAVKGSVKHSKKYIDWKKAIKKSIGYNILNDEKNTYLVSCQINNEDVVDFAKKGTLIVDELWKYVEKQDVFRVDITRLPTNNAIPKSWIILRN